MAKVIGIVKRDGYEVRFLYHGGKIRAAIFKNGTHTGRERYHADKWEVLDTYTNFFGSQNLAQLDWAKPKY